MWSRRSVCSARLLRIRPLLVVMVLMGNSFGEDGCGLIEVGNRGLPACGWLVHVRSSPFGSSVPFTGSRTHSAEADGPTRSRARRTDLQGTAGALLATR